MSATRERILDAAEELFAEHGIEATSLRAIVARAGVNLAAIHYYFGSKSALLAAVIHRRVGPVNQERLRQLEAYERRYRRVPLPKILDAFFDPMIELLTDPAGGQRMLQLIGRLMTEPGYLAGEIVPQEFGPVRERFLAAFRKALPRVPEEELFWRMLFSIGATAQGLRLAPYVAQLSAGLVQAADPQRVIRYLKRYVLAGLKAASTGRNPDDAEMPERP